MRHEGRLLVDRLDGDEPHGRPGHRLADRGGIGGIVLAAPHVRLHVGWRHQPDRMAELDEFARPVMRRGAGLHADQARR